MEIFVELVADILDDVKDEEIKKILKLKIASYKSVFCEVRWREADIEDAIESRTDIENPTEENISDVRDMIEVGALEDRMIEEGWEYVNDAVDRWDEERKENK